MSEDVVGISTQRMRASAAYSHPFLDELRSTEMTRGAATRFAAQWYQAAIAHKKSFPGLIYNSPDDHVRLQLIEILREEYGFGHKDRIHSRILLKFLKALGLDMAAALATPPESGVDDFAKGVDVAWTQRDPVRAFGVHFALEFLAANMHGAFYAGVQTLGLEPDDIEYFRIHSTAEIEHSRIAEAGMRYLASDPSNAEQLLVGVNEGADLVKTLLDGLEVAYHKSIN